MHENCFFFCLFGGVYVCVITWVFVVSPYWEGTSERKLILWPYFISVWDDVEAWVHSGICADGSFVCGWLGGERWMKSELASRAGFCLWFSIVWWQEPHQLGQIRCALSSCPNLAFVPVHVQCLVFVSQNKLTGVLQGCLQGVQTWVLFESSHNLGILFSFLMVEMSNILKIILSKVNLGKDRTWDSYCRMREEEKSCKRAYVGVCLNTWFCQNIVGLEECWQSMQMKYSDR